MKVYIQEVTCKKDLKLFIEFPFELYQGNSFWTPPFLQDEFDTFDKIKNPIHERAESICFLAYKNHKIVGRVAVIINDVEVKDKKILKLRFGWLDFINDFLVSSSLFDKIVEIANKKGLNFIEGPMGFTNFDKAGLLTRGYSYQNTMVTWYNFPYYVEHLLRYGFIEQTTWVEYLIKCPSKIPKRVEEFSKLIIDRYNLKVIRFNSKKQLKSFAEDFFELIKSTYSNLSSYVPFTKGQEQQYLKMFLKFVHLDFIICLQDNKGKLVAFAIALPSYSTALKKAKGKLFPFGFIYLLKAHYCYKQIAFYLIGVSPSYQKKGLTSVIFKEFMKKFISKRVKYLETNPELIENKGVRALWNQYENICHKERKTFRKYIS